MISPTSGAVKTGKPTFRAHRGRTWDGGDGTRRDGTVVTAHLDTTWGTRFYFQHGGAWYAAPVLDCECGQGELAFDLRRIPVRKPGRTAGTTLDPAGCARGRPS